MPHDANGLSFSPADHQWTEQFSWPPYQTVGGAQDFQYQATVGHTYRQASKSGAGVQTNQNAQEFEDFAPQATAQYGSNNNSPAFSAAEVDSLHSEISVETAQSSNFVSSLSNCSPSIPDMDAAYDTFGEFDMDGAFHSGYPMSTTVDSPAAFSTVMSRGNSSLGNMQQFHNNSPRYVLLSLKNLHAPI